MPRLDDIDRRLMNWGRWKHGAGAGGLGYGRVAYTEPAVDCDSSAESVIPTIDCEAQETDDAVMSLPSELRATVEVYYVLGGSMDKKARRLAVSESTIRARIARAHPMIQNWIIDRQQQRRQERERVEALQRVGRKGF